MAGDHRVFRALVEEAGAAWADDVHDLLELAKALAVRGARPRGGGLAILTCSGGDSGLGADEAARGGVDAAGARGGDRPALRERLPEAATVANPLDYTAMIWGEVETLRELIRTVGEDPAIGHVLVFYDRPPGIANDSWRAGRRSSGHPRRRRGSPGAGDGGGDAAGAARRRVRVGVLRGGRAGGRRAAHRRGRCAPPWRRRRPTRLVSAAIASAIACRRGPSRWLAEHEAKARLRAPAFPS